MAANHSVILKKILKVAIRTFSSRLIDPLDVNFNLQAGIVELPHTHWLNYSRFTIALKVGIRYPRVKTARRY